MEPSTANGAPAMIHRAEEQIDYVLTLAPDENGKIAWLYVMLNPDKLPSIN